MSSGHVILGANNFPHFAFLYVLRPYWPTKQCETMAIYGFENVDFSLFEQYKMAPIGCRTRVERVFYAQLCLTFLQLCITEVRIRQFPVQISPAPVFSSQNPSKDSHTRIDNGS